MDFITFFNSLKKSDQNIIINQLHTYDCRNPYKVDFTIKESTSYEAYIKDYNWRRGEDEDLILASWKEEINLDDLYKIIKEQDGSISIREEHTYTLDTTNADFNPPVREFLEKHAKLYEMYKPFYDRRLLEQGLMAKKKITKKRTSNYVVTELVWKD